MRKWKCCFLLIVLGVIFSSSVVFGHARTFKSAQFLEWPEKTRSFYIRTSIGMAGFIAGQNDKGHAKCLEAWFFDDEEEASERIYEAMRQYPDYHPRAVIIAVLQKQCGSFQYSGR